MITTVTNDHRGNPVVKATFNILITDITEELHHWLVSRGEARIELYNKIPAIKHIRELYQYLGLREAKDAVEFIIEQEGDSWAKDREERDRLEQEVWKLEKALSSLKTELAEVEERVWPTVRR